MIWDSARESQVDRLEEQLRLLHRRSRRVARSVASRVHPDIDGSLYAVLQVIAQAGPLRLIELADEFGLDKSTMSRHVTTLIQLGLVQRDPDPLDGRAFLLSPTTDGTDRLAAATSARRSEWRARLDGWTTADLADVVNALHRLNGDLD
ncbi:MarR family winged helix-turn-helix transcriptional regulator [Pseudonocardia spinosispora]|uniref:MarR family winged helix-turn-helix transcriptional regulator n=1 Tax=Pseudonocardia spinosispora TaxID=103441 RepID=UPI00146FB3F8|nr:MarR family transcriptional regulator [Pseudonocardia spinosispora]